MRCRYNNLMFLSRFIQEKTLTWKRTGILEIPCLPHAVLMCAPCTWGCRAAEAQQQSPVKFALWPAGCVLVCRQEQICSVFFQPGRKQDHVPLYCVSSTELMEALLPTEQRFVDTHSCTYHFSIFESHYIGFTHILSSVYDIYGYTEGWVVSLLPPRFVLALQPPGAQS